MLAGLGRMAAATAAAAMASEIVLGQGKLLDLRAHRPSRIRMRSRAAADLVEYGRKGQVGAVPVVSESCLYSGILSFRKFNIRTMILQQIHIPAPRRTVSRHALAARALCAA